MTPVAANKPPTASRRAHHEPPPQLDAPLRTAFGLLILWASLGLIFWAHSISDNYIRLDKTAQVQNPAATNVLQALMQTSGANLPDYSPAEAMMRMVDSLNQQYHLNLKYDRDNFNRRLSQTPRTFEITGMPLFKALHRLIDNRDVGYALRGDEILVYPQKLQSPPMDHSQMNWEAELDITDQQLSIFPSGDSDLWFTIQMIRDITSGGDPWRTLQVGLWRGGDCLNTARATLDASGKAIISAATRENISFQIERTQDSPGHRTPGRFRLIFNFQSFEQTTP